MGRILITGGVKLFGEIRISGAKNGALPILAASLLTDKVVSLSNMPDLVDIRTMVTLLAQHGASVSGHHETLKIRCDRIDNLTAPYEIVKKMRASFWVLAPLLTRFRYAKVSMPGGCTIGTRQVDLHLKILEAMGAQITIEDGYVIAKTNKRLSGTRFTFKNIPSVGATITGIMAAVLAIGTTHLVNCAKEPEIEDLCEFLVKIGAKISGIGTKTLAIEGVKNLEDCEHTIIPDRIEAGTYMIAAGITGGKIKLKNVDVSVFGQVIDILKASGMTFNVGENYIEASGSDELLPVDICTNPYPAFPTDLQAQFMALMTIAHGRSMVTENMFENRFMHAPELCRMGAQIIINDRTAVIQGTKKLRGAHITASDLRASVALVLAGLVAEGETVVQKIYHIDRGYAAVEAKLRSCGANIKRL